MLASVKCVPQEKCLKCFASIQHQAIHKRAHYRDHPQILNVQRSCIHSTVLTSHHQIVTCLVLGKKSL